MKDKKWLIAIIAIIAIVVILIVILKPKSSNDVSSNNESVQNDKDNEFVEVQNDGTRLNKSKKFLETKEFEGLEISNIRFTEKNNITEILADVKNTTSKDIDGKYVRMKFLDKNGDIIGSLGVYIPEVKANGTATLNTNGTGDFANAYDFTMEKMNIED